VAIDMSDDPELAARENVTLVVGDATRSDVVSEAFAAADLLGDLGVVVANVGRGIVSSAHERLRKPGNK
jgi:hypothetical protein